MWKIYYIQDTGQEFVYTFRAVSPGPPKNCGIWSYLEPFSWLTTWAALFINSLAGMGLLSSFASIKVFLFLFNAPAQHVFICKHHVKVLEACSLWRLQVHSQLVACISSDGRHHWKASCNRSQLNNLVGVQKVVQFM